MKSVKIYKCEKCQSPCILISSTDGVPVTCPTVVREHGVDYGAEWKEYECTLVEV